MNGDPDFKVTLCVVEDLKNRTR